MSEVLTYIPRADLEIGPPGRELVNIYSKTRRGYVWLCENTVIMVPDRTYLTTTLDGAVEIECAARQDGLTVRET